MIQKIKQDNPHLTAKIQLDRQEGQVTFFTTVDPENIPLTIKVSQESDNHFVFFSDASDDQKFNFVGTLN